MNAYFFKMTNEERKNILDQHKDLYDGYVTRYNQSNEQPLYVQDFANDKAGITVNNKGEVGEYRNMRINEDAQAGSLESFGQEPNMDETTEVEERLDMIGDGEDDLEHGTFEDDVKFAEFDFDMLEDLDEEESSSLTESVNKSLDMFRRFKNY